jgi:DnaJ-domain-containing protein 1
MQLPSRLARTTLGDVLGTAHRARATGVVELRELSGRCHRVYFASGKVTQVELDGASTPLLSILRAEGHVDEETPRRTLLRAMSSHRMVGEVLVNDFHVARSVVDAALRRQILERLARLETLSDAQLSFRVAVRAPPSATAGLEGNDFLRGRRRHRDRIAKTPTPAPVGHAFRVLGVGPNATRDEIRAAYRALAKSLHPDLHPHATDGERTRLGHRLAEVTAAYRALTG